jgi:peptidoglycan L-alanyl-D-glutamate endopeptidase CwlK
MTTPLPRDRTLDSLDPRFLPLVYQLLARLTEAGILVMIIETRRTEAQHQADLASGHSWIAHSLHQDGLAIDLAPYQTYNETGADKLQWQASDPLWGRMGAIGKALGLGWGGDWQQKDLGHFEFVTPHA